MKLSGPQRTITRARALRDDLTLPETMLWQRLRGSPSGLRFRRQHPAGPYILDFFCATATLVVEIDGIGHAMGDAAERDARRDAWLAAQGMRVWRIPARDVLQRADAVGAAIIAVASERSPLRRCAPPPPEEGEELRSSPSSGGGGGVADGGGA